jgi:hypothetical protein
MNFGEIYKKANKKLQESTMKVDDTDKGLRIFVDYQDFRYLCAMYGVVRNDDFEEYDRTPEFEVTLGIEFTNKEEKSKVNENDLNKVEHKTFLNR